MIRQITLAAVLIILFFSLSSVAFGDLSVGVKTGDWIEYSVSYTGMPVQGHDVTFAHMEIINVQGTNISVTITSRFSDDSTETTNYTLNLQTGHLIDDFIIPANLNAGDTFKDENLGNVTISKAETHQYAGAARTVLSASAGNNMYVWDQTSGVSVEGTSETVDYSIHTIVLDTNIWQPTPSQGFDSASLVLVAGVLLIVVIAIAVAVVRYLKKRA